VLEEGEGCENNTRSMAVGSLILSIQVYSVPKLCHWMGSGYFFFSTNVQGPTLNFVGFGKSKPDNFTVSPSIA